MARLNVVSTLERKYARLLGCQARLRRPSLSIAADLEHIEAVVRLFAPAWDKERVKPIAPVMPSRWRKRGHGIRSAIKALKQAERPLTATEIAHATYLAFGSAPPCERELAIVGTDLIWSLRRHFAGALTVIEGRPRRYRLTPPAASSLSTDGSPARP